MRQLTAVGLLALAGCAPQYATFSAEFAQGSSAGILSDAPVPVLKSVRASRTAYGRDCISVEVGKDGGVAFAHAVDATSDWAGIRVVPTVVPDIVAAVMAAVGAPFEVIGSLLGVERQPMPAPSPLSACSALYED